MRNVLIFGAGTIGKQFASSLSGSENLLGFLDNNQDKWGSFICGVEIFSPEIISKINFDRIYITTLTGIDDVKMQLCKLKIDPYKIIIPDDILINIKGRENFLTNFASYVNEIHMKGNVAEAGVFRGEFAKLINSKFNNKNLYLFDTFTGFINSDIEYEKHLISEKTNYNNTNVNLVMSKMPFPDKVIIKQGIFPDTTIGIDDSFCFVNLDMDLYKPTYEGIKFFYPRMVVGGIICLHDYYNSGYQGVKKALFDIKKYYGDILCFPIGDNMSIAIIKS